MIRDAGGGGAGGGQVLAEQLTLFQPGGQTMYAGMYAHQIQACSKGQKSGGRGAGSTGWG